MSNNFKMEAAVFLTGCSSFVFGLFPAFAGVTCFFVGPEIADRAYVFLSTIFLVLLITSVVGIPFAFFSVLRPYVGIIYIAFSIEGAALLSVLSINMIAYRWGPHWVLLGLLGPVLPFFAFVADGFSRDFGSIAYLVFNFVAVLGWRLGGMLMLGKSVTTN